MSEEGKLSDFADLANVDDWSRYVYEHLKSWPLAQTDGRWSTWSGKPYYGSNYLLLEIVKLRDGEPSEPLVVYTADEEITVGSRNLHEHFPSGDQTDEECVTEAKRVGEEWFGGARRAVVFFHGEDWRGSGPVRNDEDLTSVIKALRKWLSPHHRLNRVEVRGPWESDDVIYQIVGNRILFD